MNKVLFLIISTCLFLSCSIEEISNITIVMYGDSITGGGHWNQGLGRGDLVDKGVSGRNTDRLLKELTADVIDLDPKICFVMGGANDQLNDSTVLNLQKISKELLSHEIIPVIQSILFVGEKYPNFQQINRQTEKYNELLKNYCVKKHIHFIDLNIIIAPKSILLSRYTDDGLHLTRDAYRLWASQVKNILVIENI